MITITIMSMIGIGKPHDPRRDDLRPIGPRNNHVQNGSACFLHFKAHLRPCFVALRLRYAQFDFVTLTPASLPGW